MGFAQKEASELIAACHRRCCICHRFCGVKIELDHMLPRADNGTDQIENAIPVCFECHAEIHSYNDQHPRGRKFRPEELRKHKEQWLEICKTRPEIFVGSAREEGVGPLQAMIDELEFNLVVAKHYGTEDSSCLFLDQQFQRAIAAGSIAFLQDDLKTIILECYRTIRRENQRITRAYGHQDEGFSARNELIESLPVAQKMIESAQDKLLDFLGSAEKS